MYQIAEAFPPQQSLPATACPIRTTSTTFPMPPPGQHGRGSFLPGYWSYMRCPGTTRKKMTEKTTPHCFSIPKTCPNCVYFTALSSERTDTHSGATWGKLVKKHLCAYSCLPTTSVLRQAYLMLLSGFSTESHTPSANRDCFTPRLTFNYCLSKVCWRASPRSVRRQVH